MKNFLVIADQDRGKSFFIKENILKKFHSRKNYIYDINLEYTQFKNEIQGLPSKENFLDIVPNTTKPPSACNVIFEEATAFFSRAGVTESKLMQHIYRRFHTKNINVFVFHGLNFVPVDILPSIDFIILFKTSDDVSEVEKRFKRYPKIISAFLEVREKTKNTFFNRELKTYPDQRSKEFFHFYKVVAK